MRLLAPNFRTVVIKYKEIASCTYRKNIIFVKLDLQCW